MEPKWLSMKFGNCLGETQVVHRVQTLDFAFPWAPFGLPFGSLWLPLGSLLAPFGTLWLPLGSLGAVFGPPKHLIASGLKWYILFGSLWLPLGFLLAPSGSLLGSIPSQDLLQKTASIPSLAAFRHRTQVVHPVKTLRRLKWYILSKRLGNSSGLSCQNTKETQVVHPVKTLS